MHKTTACVRFTLLCLLLSFAFQKSASASALEREAHARAAVSVQSLKTEAKTLIRSQLGLLRFVAKVQLIVAALILLPLGWAWRRRPAQSRRILFLDFARRQLKRRSYWLCLLIVTDVFLLSNQLLARGQATGLWDADAAYGPYQILVSDFARAGSILQWDPWSNGGMPAGSDPQVGANSPINLLFGVLMGGSSRSFTLYWLLMWWLGGAGVLLLARHLKAPCWGGAVAALGFLFSGFYTGHAEHTSSVVSLSFTPFILWRLDAALLDRRFQPAIEAGAIWGLSALSGYPAQTILTGCFAALWALGRWFSQSRPSETANVETNTLTLRKTIGQLAAMAIIGGLILLPTYFAFFYEGAGTHTRVGAVPRELALTQNALTPSALATFTSPYLAALKLYYSFQGINIWPGLDISMCSIYTGVVISVLAFFAIAIRPRDRWRWWLAGIAVLSLVCALGDATPLRGWLYDWLYPTRFFRHPSLFSAYYLFSMMTLAILGTRDLTQSLRRANEQVWRRFFLATAATSGAAVLIFVIFLERLPAINVPELAEIGGYGYTIGAWLGVALLSAILWRSRNAARRIWSPVLLLALAAGDAVATSYISASTVVNLSGVDRWRTLDQHHEENLDLRDVGLRREERAAYPPPWDKSLSNDQMVTKAPTLNVYSPAENAYHLALAQDPATKGMAIGSRRIWFARQIAQVDLNAETLEAYRNRAAEIDGYPVILHSTAQMLRKTTIAVNPADLEKIAGLPAAECVDVTLLDYTPEELAFDVDCPAQGWLLVTDRWARSWKADVNGNPETVLGGNFIFRAVPVTQGRNRVSFRYRPLAFPWLTFFSWSVLLAVCLGRLKMIPGYRVQFRSLVFPDRRSA